MFKKEVTASVMKLRALQAIVVRDSVTHTASQVDPSEDTAKVGLSVDKM